MENAVKFLIIAGSMLIAIMVLTIASSLYTSLGDFVANSQESLVSTKNQQFNEQFTKYINYNTNGEELFTLTIHDVVTAASVAYENNVNGESYVKVNIKSDIEGVETQINTNSADILRNRLEKKYKCIVDYVKINSTTGRVYEVNFYEL